MKKIRILIMTILILILSVLLSGCEEPHTRESIRDEFRQKYPSVRFNIDKDCSISGEGSETPSYTWKATRTEYPYLEFKIVSRGSCGLFGMYYSMETDYDKVVGKFWYDKFQRGKKNIEYVEDGLQAYYTSVYSDRNHISEISEDVRTFSDFVLDRDSDITLDFYIAYAESVTLPNEPVNRKASHYCFSAENNNRVNEDNLCETLTMRYAQYAAGYRVGMEDFTKDELISFIGKEKEEMGFTVVKDGKAYLFKDIAQKRYGYGIPFGGVFEVLDRLDYRSLEGDAQHFSFTGIDGIQYEFSYSFNDAQYEGFEENNNIGFYYLKNGEKTLFEAPFYNQLNSFQLEKLTGISYEDGWLTQKDIDEIIAKRRQEKALEEEENREDSQNPSPEVAEDGETL